jgi:hypothetical protein
MSKHPSLDAPFLMPPPLSPKERMPVNDPCWCGSGIKWKKCHRDRENQQPIPAGKSMDDLLQTMTKGYCLHPDASREACGAKIIKAHTVQRNGGLADIAENGHVISFKRGFEDIYKNQGKIVPREIGIRHASTFMGFCSTHDHALFAPVEKAPISIDAQSAFLLSYRAVCYEYFQKDVALRCGDIYRQMDRGQPFHIQAAMQDFSHMHLEGVRRGFDEMKACKAAYDQMYRSGNLTDFSFYAARFSTAFPIVACGGFMPEFDVTSKPLQKISRGTSPLETVFVNLTVVGGKSLLVLGHLHSSSGPADQFVRSFADLPKDARANTAFHVPIEYMENTYLRPSWWYGRPSTEQDHIIHRVRTLTGAGGPDRRADCLARLTYEFVTATVEKQLQG